MYGILEFVKEAAGIETGVVSNSLANSSELEDFINASNIRAYNFSDFFWSNRMSSISERSSSMSAKPSTFMFVILAT